MNIEKTELQASLKKISRTKLLEKLMLQEHLSPEEMSILNSIIIADAIENAGNTISDAIDRTP